jgi:hypothetical protein
MPPMLEPHTVLRPKMSCEVCAFDCMCVGHLPESVYVGVCAAAGCVRLCVCARAGVACGVCWNMCVQVCRVRMCLYLCVYACVCRCACRCAFVFACVRAGVCVDYAVTC